MHSPENPHHATLSVLIHISYATAFSVSFDVLGSLLTHLSLRASRPTSRTKKQFHLNRPLHDPTALRNLTDHGNPTRPALRLTTPSYHTQHMASSTSYLARGNRNVLIESLATQKRFAVDMIAIVARLESVVRYVVRSRSTSVCASQTWHVL